MLAKEKMKAGAPVPLWMQKVRANVLRPDCPLHFRQREAGNSQYAQLQVGKINVFNTMLIYLREREQHPEATEKDWITEAIIKSGQPRLESKVC